jgi:hypothetical protein
MDDLMNPFTLPKRKPLSFLPNQAVKEHLGIQNVTTEYILTWS